MSRAYVRAVAARAGIICCDAGPDLGVDLFLRAVEVRDQQYWDSGPQLDVQLKSTTRAELHAGEVVYDLELRAYDLLRQQMVCRPCILVLLVLPEEEAQWLTQSPEELVLRRCAFWLSLRGASPTTNLTTVRITIPRRNVFSAEALGRLLDEARREAAL